MNLSSGLLPPAFYWLAHIALFILLVIALYRVQWRQFSQRDKVNVFLGTAVAVMILWQMEAGLTPGLHYHLLGGTLLTLMFGWELALVAMALVLAGVTANGMGDWMAFSINALLMGALPVLFTQSVLKLAVRFLPHYFFVYVIVNAFFCGGLAMALTVAASTLLLGCCSLYTGYQILHEYLPFAPLMMFAEAFFSGMLASGMVLMKPEWIATFDDRRYLAGK